LIRCSREEAEVIRKAAAAERRTISGYVLNAVYNRIQVRQGPMNVLGTPGTPAGVGRGNFSPMNDRRRRGA
jgi:hypothetical protein